MYDEEAKRQVAQMVEFIKQEAREKAEEIRVRAPVSRFPLDWVPLEELTSEQLAALPDNCCGTFIDPLQELPVIPNDTENSVTQFTSSGGFRQISQNFVAIDGDIVFMSFRSWHRTSEPDRGSDDAWLPHWRMAIRLHKFKSQLVSVQKSECV